MEKVSGWSKRRRSNWLRLVHAGSAWLGRRRRAAAANGLCCASRRSAIGVLLAFGLAVAALYPAHAQTIQHSCEHPGEQYRNPGDSFETTYALCPASVTDHAGTVHSPPVRSCAEPRMPGYRNANLCLNDNNETPQGSEGCVCKDQSFNEVDCYSPCQVTDRDSGVVGGGDTDDGDTDDGDTDDDTTDDDTTGGGNGGGGGGGGGGRSDRPSLSIEDATVDEDAGEARFRVLMDRTSSRAVRVTYDTKDGSALAGEDYTKTGGTLVIEAGSRDGTVAVPIVDDDIDEPEERFAVILSRAVNADIDDDEGTGTIRDNDEPQPPALTIDDVTVREDGGTADFTVALDRAAEEPVTVEYATADGSAAAGLDYGADTGTVTIEVGSTAATVAIPILDDTRDELDETFTVALANPVHATLADAEGVGTIIDDDQPNLFVDDVTVPEGAGTARFAVTLDQVAAAPVSVDYATVDATAKAGSDYEASAGTVTIEVGSTAAMVAISILDDTRDELDETFTVTLANPVHATLADEEGVGTIIDDDQPNLLVDDVTVPEGAGTARFAVTLDQVAVEPVSVDYATVDATAKAGSDYETTAGTVTIEVGSTAAMVAVPILDDTRDELDETFTVTLANPVHAMLADAEGVGTIVDDDQPNLFVDDVTVPEGAGTARFAVTLDQVAAGPVSVDYATVDATAKAGSDYETTAGTLTIAEGSVSGAVTVVILDDTVAEKRETFAMTLRNARDAAIADGRGRGTIIDDDNLPGAVGLAKEAVDTAIAEPGTVRTTFRIHVVNVGEGPAGQVQVSDDLSSAFPAPATASVVQAPATRGASLSLNPAFDGVEDTLLLTGTDSLAAGASAVVEFVVEITLNGATGPFRNQAIVQYDDGLGSQG